MRRPITAISIDQVVKKMTEKRAEALANPSSNADESAIKQLSIIVKADVNGSLEAILNVLETYNAHNQVRLDLAHFDVGPVKKSDLDVAAAFNAHIYVFNLPVNKELETDEYKIKHFNVIYKLFDDLKAELAELAPTVDLEEDLGKASVLQVFDYDEKDKGTITVAGGRCDEGLLDRKAFYRLERNDAVIASRLNCRSLKHVKNDVQSVKKNVEFGLAFENQSVVPMKGDMIVCYSVKKVKQAIEWNLGF